MSNFFTIAGDLGMKFDGTITLGTVLQIASMAVLAVGLFNAVSNRLSVFEITLKIHAVSLAKHEEQIFSLISNLQKLIGQTEVEFRRRTGDHR